MAVARWCSLPERAEWGLMGMKEAENGNTKQAWLTKHKRVVQLSGLVGGLGMKLVPQAGQFFDLSPETLAASTGHSWRLPQSKADPCCPPCPLLSNHLLTINHIHSPHQPT